MKKMIAMMALAVAVFTVGAEMARSEWQGKVGACAQNPALLQQTMGQLSAADQLVFLGQVNQAISAMPGSKDQKAAAFYAANKAAVVGATRENRTAVLAEVFATVPVEVLTIINERFAEELLNRKDSPAVTDDRFVDICANVMSAVDKRVASAENGGARAAFAAMMLVRASGGSPAGLANTLGDMISDPAASRDAKSTWFPAALSGDTPSYDQILGSTQSGEEPNKGNVNSLTPSAAVQSSVLADMSNGKKDGGDNAGSDAGKGNGEGAIFQGGVFAPRSTPGTVIPNIGSGTMPSLGNWAMNLTGDSSGVSGAGSNDEGVPMPIPRDVLLSPTIIDPVTGNQIPNPYYNPKRVGRYSGQ